MVYNPFSVLNFFSTGRFDNFWFETGTPGFLVNLLKERKIYNVAPKELGPSTFNSYDIENIGTYALLFQTGYLTIKKVDEQLQLYELDYPNQEVKQSMLEYLIAAYREGPYEESTPTVIRLHKAFQENNLKSVISLINDLFATIPHHLFINQSEAYYHSLVHLLFTYLGQYTQSEVNTSRGRCDAVVHTSTHIYLLEFKLDKSAKAALQQIHKKSYFKKFRLLNKIVVGVGVNFSSTSKKVESWLAEELADQTNVVNS